MLGESDFIWDIFEEVEADLGITPTSEIVAPIMTPGDIDRAGVDRLNARVDRLTLLCRAMYELMGKRSGISNQQLAAKMTEIDLRDGVLDGKLAPSQKTCPQCSGKICAKFNRCLFCGYQDVSGDPFDMV